jgi:hypothetical protein
MLYPALVTALAVLGAFIVPLVLSYGQSGSRAPGTSPPTAHVAPRVIQNSSIVYRLGWVALAPLMAWGIVGEIWPVVVYLVAVALGLSLVYALRRPLLQALQDTSASDRPATLHRFIARCHGNDARVGAFAAALSVFVIYGLIGCVMIGLATVLRTMFAGDGALADAFVAAIVLIAAGATLRSSRFGILYATQVQLGLVYFALFAAAVLLLYLQGSAIGAMPFKGIAALFLIAIVCALVHFRRRSRYLDSSVRPSAADAAGARAREPLDVRLFIRLQKILNSLVGILAMTLAVLALIVTGFEIFLGGMPAIGSESLAALRSGASASIMTLISLFLLPLLQPIVDVVSWQRAAVFAEQQGQYQDGDWTAAFRTFGTTLAREVPVMALFVVLFGVIAGLTLPSTPEGLATQAFLASLVTQDNAVAATIASLLTLGVLALAVATIGSLFAAAVDVVGSDIVPAVSASTATASAEKPAGRDSLATLLSSVLILVLVLATFGLAEMRSDHTFGIAGLLGAMLAVGSVQMALVPLALAPLLSAPRRSAGVTPAWALAVLAVGAAIGIGIAVAGLVFGQAAALPFAVPATFAASTLVFLIGLRFGRADVAASSGGASAR